MNRIGIDLGGTKVEVLALRADGTEALRARVPSPREYGPLIDAIAGLVASADRALGPAAHAAPVGLGAPGSPNPRTGRARRARCASRTTPTALPSARRSTARPRG
ncbi:MAG: ROK family protein, partial [Phycisphaerales bacterium]